MKAAVGSGSEIGEFGRPAKLGIRIFACVMITVMPSQGQPEEEGGMADESVLLMEEMADMRDNLREELHAYREELRSEGFSKREISIATARFREANQAAYDWLRESKQSLVDLRHELDGAPRPPEARSAPIELTDGERSKLDQLTIEIEHLRPKLAAREGIRDYEAMARFTALREAVGRLLQAALMKRASEHHPKVALESGEPEYVSDPMSQRIANIRNEKKRLRPSLIRFDGSVNMDVARALEDLQSQRKQIADQWMLDAINSRK